MRIIWNRWNITAIAFFLGSLSVMIWDKQKDWHDYLLVPAFAIFVGYLLVQWQAFMRLLSAVDNHMEGRHMQDALMGSWLAKLDEVNGTIEKRMESISQEFNNKFNDAKLEFITKLSEIDQNRDRALTFLDKYATYKDIARDLTRHLKKDLSLDEHLQQCEDFHKTIYEAKYGSLLEEYFVYNESAKKITQIPSKYFKDQIWKKFLGKVDCYYSTQLLSSDTFDPSEELKEYLKEWHNSVETGDTKKEGGKVLMKYIKYSEAERILDRRSGKLDDIGIFDNIYGVQQTDKDKGKDCLEDELKIEFFFDKEETNVQKSKFLLLFDRASCLCNIFQ